MYINKQDHFENLSHFVTLQHIWSRLLNKRVCWHPFMFLITLLKFQSLLLTYLSGLCRMCFPSEYTSW